VVPRLGGPTNLKPPERGAANLLKLLSRFTGFLTTKGADKKTVILENLTPPELGTANLLKILSRFTGFLTTKGADKKNSHSGKFPAIIKLKFALFL